MQVFVVESSGTMSVAGVIAESRRGGVLQTPAYGLSGSRSAKKNIVSYAEGQDQD
jgi:hypothetical protein